ncbi:Antibiotic biosynthesis monooxygenase [Burkholderiales bacterium 8X]|nr:Antibiotic biosynthesis monooxygenase [Burkholderiales bacterium 8X]
MAKILRTWTFWIDSKLQEECRLHLEANVLASMRGAGGNRRAVATFRDHGDGTCVVVVMSVWDSMADIVAFSGADADAPRIDAHEEAKLIDKEPHVRHYAMTESDLRGLLPPLDS